MPINLDQIKSLLYFSNSNFKKYECEQCRAEFYSIRQCKYCCNACKQNAYRIRLQRNDIEPKDKPSENVLDKESTSNSKIDFELKEKMKKYENKIESINQ